MQEDFLAEYPLAPTADQAAFAAASALLESKDFARAAVASQRYAARYPDSELLDDFWFMAGYCRFILGEPEPAIELLRNVATGKFLDKASGQFGESDNKWSAIYVLGQIYHSLGRVVEALQEYRLVEDRFPDAKASIADFLREAMRLPELTTVRPGKPVEIELVHRNVATCELKVYRIDLEKFAVLRRTLAGIRDINLAGIEPYREATVALGDGKDYRDLHRVLPLELTEEGAYLIVCRGGSQFASGLVLVTSLELEVYRDPQAGSVRVTLKDVTSDQYVPGADVKVIGAGKAGDCGRPDGPARFVRRRGGSRQSHGDRACRGREIRVVPRRRLAAGHGGRRPERPVAVEPACRTAGGRHIVSGRGPGLGCDWHDSGGARAESGRSADSGDLEYANSPEMRGDATPGRRANDHATTQLHGDHRPSCAGRCGTWVVTHR